MSKFKGKKVLIVGFGTSGISVARYMHKQGAQIVVTDSKQKTDLADAIAACSELKIEYDLGKHTQKYFVTSDLIVVSPGVPLNLKLLDEAREKGIPITTEIDLAASLLKEPLIAITGTNGKTTTTRLLGEIFKSDQKPVFVGGNIGQPLLDHSGNGGGGTEVVVAEVSSFQLESCDKMVPAVAVFTNIDQDHLDRYGTMEAYINAKKRLLQRCDKTSFVVLNHDDPNLLEFSNESPGRVLWFMKKDPMTVGGEFAESFTGAYFVPGTTRIVGRFNGKEEVYDVSKFRLFGDHNKENAMAAICAARAMGVSPAAIQKTLNEFEGMPHRLEFVRKKDGVYFINDSKSTNVSGVRVSLEAFRKNPIILVAGGKDKDSDYSVLGDLVQKKVKIMILLGEAKEKINRAIGDYTETYLVGTFEEAVLMAYQKSRTGDIILLSPGCASYDMFKNYEERGDYFKKLVQQF